MTTNQNPLIGMVVQKSLYCFILTFVVNLIMNILKISLFIGSQSDALTPCFEIIESTLLVEALRFEPERMSSHAYCQNCGMVIIDMFIHTWMIQTIANIWLSLDRRQ